MGESAGSVAVELTANSVKLRRDLIKAERATRKTARRMQGSMTRSFKNIGRAASQMRNLLLAGFGVQLIRSVVNAGLQMEKFQRGLKVVAGSAEGAAREFAFITKEAKRLGLDLEQTAQAYTKLAAASKNTALAGQATRDIFIAIAEASTVLGLSGSAMSSMLVAIEQMMSKGKISAEELRKQMQQLPGAFPMAARSIGKTTMELDKMLKAGELLAEDLLPQFAKEIRRTFGPGVEDAVNSAAASFNRLKTAIFELNVSLAESGILDFLAQMATGWSIFLSPSDEQRFAELTQRSMELRQEMKKWTGPNAHQFHLDFVNKNIVPQLKEVQDELDLIIAKRKAAFRIEGVQEIFVQGAKYDPSFIDDQIKKARERTKKEIKRIRDSLKSDIQLFFEYKKHLEELVEQTDLTGEEAAAAIQLRADEIEDAAKDMVDDVKDSFSEMDEFAKQAARNMQDALADWLFEPFQDGLDGMLKGFIDVIRRMLANQLAAQFFRFLGGQGGFIGSFFGGARAHGGPVTAGVAYDVGEKGKERFVPTENGVIIPNNKLVGGGGNVINNYSFEAGANIATIMQEVIPKLEQMSDVTLARMTQMRLEGTG